MRTPPPTAKRNHVCKKKKRPAAAPPILAICDKPAVTRKILKRPASAPSTKRPTVSQAKRGKYKYKGAFIYYSEPKANFRVIMSPPNYASEKSFKFTNGKATQAVLNDACDEVDAFRKWGHK